jgi:CheY-like chemotaxis protein
VEEDRPRPRPRRLLSPLAASSRRCPPGSERSRQGRPSRPAIRILLTSGFADPAALKEGLAENADGWLAKPHSLDDLQARLAEILDG